jgi:hypothetical protein
MICETCIYWGGHIYSDNETLPGPCSRFDEDDGKSDMAEIVIDIKYPEFIEKILFNTDAEFGCNQWAEGEA